MSNKFALCVGINDYPGSGNDLAGCVNDANDVKDLLESHGYQVHVLLDSDATSTEIKKALEASILKAHYGDTFVFHYSGHGTWVPDENGDEADGRDEALCPHDVFDVGPITDDELSAIFSERSRGVKLIFIGDSCHSGTVSRFAPNLSRQSVRRVKFMPPEVWSKNPPLAPRTLKQPISARLISRLPAARILARSAALLLAGCADTEYSYDAVFDGRPNGAFTRVAIDTLKTLEAGGTYRKWYAAIRKRLPSIDYPQTPSLYGVSYQKDWKI